MTTTKKKSLGVRPATIDAKTGESEKSFESESKSTSKTRSSDKKKTLPPPSNLDLTRTHKAFGLFPNALLLFGYGESKQENERIITTEEKSVQTGEVITRQMKIYTNSAKGLPRGRDPQVLIALLHMTLQKPGSTNSLWFRKKDLIDTLGWIDSPENRQDIDEAVSRYFEAAYTGLDVKTNAGGSKTKENYSRIITDYTNIDERKTRYLDSERSFSKVVFNEAVINQIRSAELSLHLNLKIIQLLQNAPTALRLYEAINYLTSPLKLKFEIDIKELAYNRLGISQSKKTPGQCLQAIKPAAQKLLDIGYLKSFEYSAETRMINGEVSKKMVSPSTEELGSLPNVLDKRKKIIQQFVALEAYPNPTATIINSLPEDLLDDAEIIAELITREKSENAFGHTFRYGGRALKQLKNLQATGEISQNLLEKVHQEVLIENADATEPLELLDGSEIAHSIDFEPSNFAAKNDMQAQLPLQPITFTEIRAVSDEAVDLWRKCFFILQTKLSAKIIDTWFTAASLSPLTIEAQTLILQTMNQTNLSWIEQTYSKILQDALNEATGTQHQWQIKLVL